MHYQEENRSSMPCLIRRLCNWLLDQFYGPLAFFYPVLTRFFFGSAWEQWQRSVEHWLIPNRMILELGCGPGNLARYLATRGYQVIALDRSRSMLRLARRQVVSRRVLLLQADARALPLVNGCIDAVVMTFPTAVFYSQDLHREIARVLRSNGVFIAIVAAWPYRWPFWLGPLIPLLRRWSCQPSLIRKNPPTLLRGRWEISSHTTGILLVWVAQGNG